MNIQFLIFVIWIKILVLTRLFVPIQISTPEIKEPVIAPTQFEQRINEVRKEHKLKELKPNNCLRERAAIRYNEVLENWSHERPNGTPYYAAKFCEQGIYQGENLARYDTGDGAITINSWLNSPTHRNVLLSERYDFIGIYQENGYTIMEVMSYPLDK